MDSTKTTVYKYGGVLPKSGKQVTQFADHTLVHRSVKADKSDLLVHLETRIIVRAYPLGTDRSVILNDLADNFEKLEHFLANRELYEVQTRPKLLKVKDSDTERTYDMTREPSYSTVGSFAHLNKDSKFKLPIKKKYDLSENKW